MGKLAMVVQNLCLEIVTRRNEITDDADPDGCQDTLQSLDHIYREELEDVMNLTWVLCCRSILQIVQHMLPYIAICS